jgi:hypothetical protein
LKLLLKSPSSSGSGSTTQSKNKFDKYWYYRHSVQSPDIDVKFFRKVYKELKDKSPKTLREDFCGTFAISCEWVKLKKEHEAVGVDLDPEPIQYGINHYLPELKKSQQERITIIEENVLASGLPKTDIVAACNFSYFIFKDRKTLKSYFQNVYDNMKKDGVFILDCFGGSECYEPSEEETEHDTFSYFWDQDSYDPVTNEAMFYIWFKPKGKKKVKAFTYDWRMWSIPELKDILEEVGFTKIHTYWEGTDEDGEGDGEFTRVEHGEDCESWVAYLACER